MSLADESLLDLEGSQRWIVVAPVRLPWTKACEAISRLRGVWPPTSDVVRLARPDLTQTKVYVLDREAILALPPLDPFLP